MSFFVAGPTRSAVAAPQRPLALVATLGGAIAALVSLGVCLVVGVIGWYLTDAGSHGAATGGLRVGAISWLVGHGTGLSLQGVDIGPLPLGVTALIVWVTWQVGLRVGGHLVDHGPDAAGLADGSRDLVVPTAALLFVAGYSLTALVVDGLASRNGAITASATLGATIPFALFIGLPAIAVDSGRMQEWVADVPQDLRGILIGLRGLLVGWFAVSAVAFVIALLIHGTTAVNMISEMHLSGGSVVAYLGALLVVLPDAIVYAGSYVIGAPYSLGLGTTVSPHTVHVGLSPWIPWIAATPTVGSAWFYLVLLLPMAVAAVVAVRVERRTPAPSLGAAAVRAAAYSLLAALAIGILGWWAGGGIGSGLMVGFGTSGGSMFVHAVYWIVLPSVLAAAAAWWWEGRTVEPSAEDH